MCGIAGVMSAGLLRSASPLRTAEVMSERLAHRGPDDVGSWADDDAGVALGFRRLSIVDLSRAGHQPMRSATGRFSLVFNGEVYNHVELRVELESGGARFAGHSDTEVILSAFERWGIRDAVRRFVGMFAMAVWDGEHRRLVLLRDRLGIKPLYYFSRPGLLLFASELKALAAVPEFDRTLDEVAVDEYLRYLYVPAPRTIYKHASKLLPGHILEVQAPSRALPESEAYWTLDHAYERGRAEPFSGSDAEAIEELTRLLGDAVRLRMRADVPMGALLSGGIDSSTVVALMQRDAARPTRTFSVGFPGTEHDESVHAATIAARLGTDHTELAVRGEEALAVVPSLPDLFDEPLADPSQIPTYLVCKLASQHVTVALTGDGGDELFGGYERYVRGEPIISGLQRVPTLLRQAVGAGVGTMSAAFWDRTYRVASPILPGLRGHRLAGNKMRKLGNLLRQESESAMYRSLLSAWQDTADILATPARQASRNEELLQRHQRLPLLDRMMLVDQQSYLPDDLLSKVDRASMAVSIEARVPLLDHRVVEFSWRLPRKYKVRDRQGKWLLRQVLHRFVDPALVDRPKTGFSVPIGPWMRGPLREWAEAMLFDGSIVPIGLRSDRVKEAWVEFQNGADQQALALWAVVMLQSWTRRWLA